MKTYFQSRIVFGFVPIFSSFIIVCLIKWFCLWQQLRTSVFNEPADPLSRCLRLARVAACAGAKVRWAWVVNVNKPTGLPALDLYLNGVLFIGVILGGLIRYISSQFGV